MKETYTPAEADILLVNPLNVDLISTSGETGGSGGIGGGGYDPGGWT